eukprot:8367-Heterococcus_DN1.PRE.2
MSLSGTFARERYSKLDGVLLLNVLMKTCRDKSTGLANPEQITCAARICNACIRGCELLISDARARDALATSAIA